MAVFSYSAAWIVGSVTSWALVTVAVFTRDDLGVLGSAGLVPIPPAFKLLVLICFVVANGAALGGALVAYFNWPDSVNPDNRYEAARSRRDLGTSLFCVWAIPLLVAVIVLLYALFYALGLLFDAYNSVANALFD